MPMAPAGVRALEGQPRPKLQDARIARSVDDSQSVRRCDARSRQAEIRVVQQVEELAPQHQICPVRDRKWVLDGSIDVEGRHAAQEVPRRIAKGSRGVK